MSGTFFRRTQRRASRAGNKTFLEAQALLLAMRGKSPELRSELSLDIEVGPRKTSKDHTFRIYDIEDITPAHKDAIRAIRKMKYLVCRRKFQQARKPFDVKDVMEQYSQGHLNMMQRIKELQRRIDCTIGKPGSFQKAGQGRPLTVGARLQNMDRMLVNLDQKVEDIFDVLQVLADRASHNRTS